MSSGNQGDYHREIIVADTKRRTREAASACFRKVSHGVVGGSARRNVVPASVSLSFVPRLSSSGIKFFAFAGIASSASSARVVMDFFAAMHR